MMYGVSTLLLIGVYSNVALAVGISGFLIGIVLLAGLVLHYALKEEDSQEQYGASFKVIKDAYKSFTGALSTLAVTAATLYVYYVSGHTGLLWSYVFSLFIFYTAVYKIVTIEEETND